MEKEYSGEKSPILFCLKCLLFSYILTAVLLLFLSFVLYKVGLTEAVVSIAIIAVYVISTFFAGFITGKKMQSRRFLWGLMMGGGYFLVLLLVSLLVNHTVGELGNSVMTTLALCTCGGMLGGMLS